jgi:hypothetical protein
MKAVMKRLSRCLLAAAALMLLLAGASCDSCGSEAAGGKAGDAERRRATPAVKPQRQLKARQAGKASGLTDAELPTITVRSVAGKVTIVTRAGEAARQARGGDEITGGGELAVAGDAAATVVIREVGLFSLAPDSTVVVPAHAICGAVLVEGAALTTGPARSRRDPPCYLHTATGALQHPRAKAVVAVAPSGRARIAATEGAVRVVALVGDPIEIAAGSQITLDPREGLVGGATPFVHESGPVERVFDEWRGSQPYNGKVQPKWMLDEASRLAERLALDAERLAELMAQNREVSARRRAQSFKPDASAGQQDELTGQLAQQAGELVLLKNKGTLLTGRIVALVELTQRHAPGMEQERIAAVRAGLDKLAADLPPLFERRRKPAVRTGEVNRLKHKLPMLEQ